MRVAMIGPYPRLPKSPHGGVEAAVENLAEAIAGLGIEVSVFDPFTGYAKADLELNPTVVRLNRSGPWRALVPRAPRDLREAVADWDPDIVHVHLGAQLTKMHPASVLTVHGFPHLESRLRNPGVSGRFRSIPLKYTFEAGVRASATVVAISEEARRAAHKARVPAISIPNPVAAEFFEVERDPGEDFVAVGNVMRRKNQLQLIRAFGQFAASGGVGDLVLAGEIEDHEYFEECRLESAAFSSRVHYLGPLPRAEVAALLSTARAAVSTSLRETSSIAISESFAANCPVVCFDVGTVRVQVTDPRFGAVLPVDSSVQDVATQLLRVEAGPFDGHPLRTSVADQHPTEVARQTVEVYESVLATN